MFKEFKTNFSSKISVLVLMPVFFFGFTKAYVNQEIRNEWVSVASTQTVGQTFVADEDNLFRIELFVKNPSLVNKNDLIFHLRLSPESQEDLATVNLSGLNVGSDYHLRIQFPPVKNSKGKSFYFFLESPKSGFGEAILISRVKEDAMKDGNAWINNKPIEGDLFLITSYKLPIERMFFGSPSSLVERFISDLGFSTFYLSLLFLFLILVTYSAVKKR